MRIPPSPDSSVDNVYALLRDVPFPLRPLPTPEKITRVVARLRALKMEIVDELIVPWSSVGSEICTPFFPNRFQATFKGEMSAYQAWRDEILMKKAIAFQLRRGDPVTPVGVLRALSLICRTPNVFRAQIARFVYERFCPMGGRVWDACAGFGGRALGAHAAGVRYVGTDVDAETVEGNRRLIEQLGARGEVFACPAEIFDPPEVDLVFTSPPYFDRERYSHNENQSWKKYGRDLDAWVAGFLCPMIQNARRALRAGGHLVLNVADLRERGTVIPIVDRTVAAALGAGFIHVRTLWMPLAAIKKTLPSEPLLVFRLT